MPLFALVFLVEPQFFWFSFGDGAREMVFKPDQPISYRYATGFCRLVEPANAGEVAAGALVDDSPPIQNSWVLGSLLVAVGTAIGICAFFLGVALATLLFHGAALLFLLAARGIWCPDAVRPL